jgi:hypothetical protein
MESKGHFDSNDFAAKIAHCPITALGSRGSTRIVHKKGKSRALTFNGEAELIFTSDHQGLTL